MYDPEDTLDVDVVDVDACVLSASVSTADVTADTPPPDEMSAVDDPPPRAEPVDAVL